MPDSLSYMRKKFWKVTDARVWFSAANRDAFLGLHRLVQAIGPASPGHEAPGELVDDDDLGPAVVALLDQVVDVALLKSVMGFESPWLHGVQHRDHLRVVEVVDA